MLMLKTPRETLLKVAECLENGTIKDEQFNFLQPADSVTKCACIGGHAWLMEHDEDYVKARMFVNSQLETSATFYHLFWPSGAADCGLRNPDHVTKAQAAIAIRRFLAGEKNFWDHTQKEKVDV